MWGGGLLNHHQCAASTLMMRRQPQDNGASVLTTHLLQVESYMIVKPTLMKTLCIVGLIYGTWAEQISL